MKKRRFNRCLLVLASLWVSAVNLQAQSILNRLPDTGQTFGYSQLYGEDGDYAINPPAYSDLGNEVIYDQVTGLFWQKTDGGEMTWQNARNYCNSLDLAGWKWRLPKPFELFGILDHSKLNPSMNTIYYGSTRAEYWWTLATRQDDSTKVWSVNAGGGIGPHPKNETISAGGAKKFHVRCVRDVSWSSGMKDNGDGTVTDSKTELTWIKTTLTEPLSWLEAIRRAEGYTFAGYSDWRLPNVKELQSVVDEGYVNPSIHPDYFPGTTSLPYWTSTTLVNDTARAWMVDFRYGIVTYKDKMEPLKIRLVRGGFDIGQVIPQGATLEKIATGFRFTEGPCWLDEGALLFSDIEANKVYRWKPDGTVSTYLDPSGNSNGIALDIRRNIVLAQHGERQVGQVGSDGNVTTLCGSYQNKRLNSPNDLVFRNDGTLYFTDPPYGISQSQRELDFNGVYMLKSGATAPVAILNSLSVPNGIALSPDHQTLYVCDSDTKNLYAYALKTDGTIKNGGVLASFGSEIDGVKTDLDNRIYVAASVDGVIILDRAGKKLDTIPVPERTRNLCWGGDFRKDLFITAGTSVYRIHLNPLSPLAFKGLLGQPTDRSVAINLVAESACTAFIEYGTSEGVYTQFTETSTVDAGVPLVISILSLQSDTRYFYRVRVKSDGGDFYKVLSTGTFHTQRNPSSNFTFDVQADTHLDSSSNFITYRNALANTIKDAPDFMIELGDNFLSEKLPLINQTTIERRALLYREFYSEPGQTVPVYLVLGNHEGEAGWLTTDDGQNVAVWNTLMRKKYFLNPSPDAFYSGDSVSYPNVGKRNSYYSWEWGDALFVVLDPYWFTAEKPAKTDGGWDWTLGESQYLWFRKVLSESRASFKFVFCHHLVGGGEFGRGGSEWAPFFEMGGMNADNTYGFDNQRPGWGKPIHQVMKENGVTIFFHGHDHFFARQELDQVVYQLVPQPSLMNYNPVASSIDYGYVTGTILPNSGHLRVSVSGEKVRVEYIRAYHEESASQVNGEIAYAYEIIKSSGIENINSNLQSLMVWPNPTSDFVYMAVTGDSAGDGVLDILNLQGQQIRRFYLKAVLNSGGTFMWNMKNSAGVSVPPGIYLLHLQLPTHQECIKLVIM